MSQESILLKQARLANGQLADVLIGDGRVTELGSLNVKADITLDCAGLILLPGFVDMHTHLREPGAEGSETIESGSRAAAAGGYTAVHAMANTNPVIDNAALAEQVFRIGREVGLVDVRPVGAITRGLEGQVLADIGQLAESKAAVKLFSDDGHCVADPLLMRRALEYAKSFGVLIAQHAQEPRLTPGAQVNEGVMSTRLGLAPWPAVAEEAIIARDLLLAEAVGARLHICHVSTAGAVELIRWGKSRGVSVSAEATPHHLLLTEELVGDFNPIFKVNPPLRRREDVEALRDGLIDGTIDVIATDHAPHPADSKECEWQAAAFGMLGLEAAASVAQLVLIESGRSDWKRLAEVMSERPARLTGLSNHGLQPAVGVAANFTLVNPAAGGPFAQRFSKSTNDPYRGKELPGRVIHTIYEGRLTLRAGEINEVV